MTTSRTAPAVVRLRVVSVALLSFGLACVVALHVVRSDLSPVGHRISEYAIGAHGWLMTVAFVAVGAGLLALGGAFVARGGRRSRYVGAALSLAGLGMVASGMWRTDETRSGTTADAIHSRASALASLALIAAALAWSVFRRGRGARSDVAAWLAVAAAVLGALSPALHRSRFTGASQRLLWITLLAWLIITAWRTKPAGGEV